MSEKKSKSKAKGKSKAKNDGPTPGAGVDPTKVCVPRKRLKKAHRAAVTAGSNVSLKQFVRDLEDGELADFGLSWLQGKLPSANAEAKKKRQQRLAPLRVKKPKTNDGKKGKKK